MRVRVNLAHPESRIERSVYLWAPIAILLAAALLAGVLHSSMREFLQYRKVHRTVLEYQGQRDELQARTNRLALALRQPATLKVYSQINFLNSLIEQKKVSLAGLTVELARLLPPSVRITGLALAQASSGPVVEISVEGAGKEVTGQFLDSIENSPDFDSVTVLDQSFEPQGAQQGLTLLTCSARYVGKMMIGSSKGSVKP